MTGTFTSRRLACLLTAVIVVVGTPGSPLVPPAAAATVTEQKTGIRRAGTYLRSVERMIKAGRNEDAAESFSKAQTLLTELSSEGIDPKLERSFNRTRDLLKEVHATLTAAGIEVDELAELTMDKGGGRSAPSLQTNNSPSAGRFDPNDVSFVRDVAPMLERHCGRCHVDQDRGGFSLASYRDLMRGSREGGRVLVPGDGRTSLITELITSGSMPPGGRTVPPQDLNKLVMWITQGAKFDGADEAANLRDLKQGGPAPAMDAPKDEPTKVARATGDETVSFALDVAPILADKCLNCHGPQRQRGGFNVASLEQMLRGGDGGQAIKHGKPDASPLVRRITGADEPRMPQNQPPLSDKEIEVISTWVREGAKFDGPNAGDPLARVTQLVRAQRATPAELSAMRVESAAKTWRLAAPDIEAATVANDRYYLVGNLPENRLREVAADASDLTDGFFELFGHPEGEPLTKGRLSVFAMGSRIDYSEFGLMVENRQPPTTERGSSRYDPIDSYAVVQLGLVAAPSDTVVLAEALAALYLSQRSEGRLPEWLVDGAARLAAAKAAPDNPTVAAWRDSYPSLLGELKRPGDLFGNRLPPDKAKLLRFGFAEGMARRPAKLRTVITKVSAGGDLDAVFKEAYNYTPAELEPLWINSLKRRR